jgi:hypothetical protein
MAKVDFIFNLVFFLAVVAVVPALILAQGH